VFCAAVALLLVLSEVFSSNIQNTLPTFSHVCRIALTVTAAVLLVAKSLLLTQWQTKQQALTAAALAAFAVFTTAYGHDQWFLFAVLLGIGAKDVDLRRVLQVYLAAAAGGLLAGPLASLLALTAALVLVIGPSRRLLGKLDAVVRISRAVVFERHIAAREVQRLLLIALRPAAVLIRGTPVLRPVVSFAGLSLPPGAVLLD